MPTNKKLVIGIIAGAAVLIVLFGIVRMTGVFDKQQVSAYEPVDVALDFYGPWLEAVQSTSTNPYEAKLADWPYLSKELRKKVKGAEGSGGLDPVLCQTNVPEDIGVRIVGESETGAEILVTARRSTSTEQAIIKLLPLEGGWYIDDIECSPGEFAPEREFSFEMEGRLVKNVPAPLNAENWHLIFEQHGTADNYVPLFFGAETMCITRTGASAVCTPDTFAEDTKVFVQAQMTEMGAEVVRMELR